MLLPFTDNLGLEHLAAFEAGANSVRSEVYRVKEAAEAEVAYNLFGVLQFTPTGWLILSVPNALVRGVFAAMHEPGIELPPGPSGLNAHISVMSGEELAKIGGADRV